MTIVSRVADDGAAVLGGVGGEWKWEAVARIAVACEGAELEHGPAGIARSAGGDDGGAGLSGRTTCSTGDDGLYLSGDVAPREGFPSGT
jgi:hypothetical protein